MPALSCAGITVRSLEFRKLNYLTLSLPQFFTQGAIAWPKIVSAAAAKHLTPVTLELGGKSPVFIDPNCDLDLTAKRLLWGKVANAGQTCLAPDYVLVPRLFQDKLVEALQRQYEQFYPDGPKAEGAYARIVVGPAIKRLKGYLEKTKGRVVLGGEVDEADRYVAPTIGNIRPYPPIVPIDDVDQAIRYVNEHGHPLGVYAFSNDPEYKKKVLTSTQSGSIVFNDQLILPGADGLPFGGVGDSGSGYHTGKYGFDIFTHLRASIDSPSFVDKILGFRFPPYTPSKLKATSRLAVSLPPKPKGPPPTEGATATNKWVIPVLVIAVTVGLTRLR
ncbi:hypothetical protein NMY22_g17917 [Coprinellus aureogranulatus]|nr:hypothetical protein NMY22_g17917 [Coprinellus aureogranulatus]